MAKRAPKQAPTKAVESLKHDEAKRKNIPTAEYQSVLQKEEEKPKTIKYPRNTDLDPQLVWRGKDEQDWSDLIVHAPPLYIQEKVHPKVLIDDLLRQTREQRDQQAGAQPDLFADFNGIPAGVDRTEFYQHDQNWSNRMILGDSLQVMASLAEREGLRGKVQCIYLDPPYGIKFNSSFQWSTTSRDVKDGNAAHITREPEQVKAFRDTWRDGIHSYLTYLRDRLTVARDLLTESGSIFVQIGDENVHRVRALMDEVFAEENFVSLISFRTTTGLGDQYLDSSCNFLVWFCRDRATLKYRELFKPKGLAEDVGARYRRVQLADYDRRPMAADERSESTALPPGASIYRNDNLTSQSGGENSAFSINYRGLLFRPGRGYWKTNEMGMRRLLRADRLANPSSNSIQYVRFLNDFAVSKFSNVWTDTQTGAFTDEKIYVVQTNAKVILLVSSRLPQAVGERHSGCLFKTPSNKQMDVKNLKINHFRGIDRLNWDVGGRFVCLIGPGDSTKSTVLEAVELVLTPRRNVSFDDADFYNADTGNPIVIEITVGEPPKDLLSFDRFGYLVRGWGGSSGIRDEPQDGDDPLLTIRLRADESLEPRWSVVGPGFRTYPSDGTEGRCPIYSGQRATERQEFTRH
jgi:hypothetical protein